VDKGGTRMIRYCNADWVESPIDKWSTIGYCAYIGSNRKAINKMWLLDLVPNLSTERWHYTLVSLCG